MREATNWHSLTVNRKTIMWIDGTERGERCVASIHDPERDAEPLRLLDFETLETKPIDTIDEDSTAPRGLICYGYSKWGRPSFAAFRELAARGHGAGYFGLYVHLLDAADEAANRCANYRAIRESIGPLDDVAALLGVDRQTIHRREIGELPIKREAELAMEGLAKRRRKRSA
jgi:hypothetical protein